jgi:peptidoglycan/LPS O-acetylase OafA/YrhL
LAKASRIGWIEALRAIALLMVIIPHFIAAFCPEAFRAWDTYSWALKGISGKHGVAIFCVLIGYFSSRKTGESLPTYIIQRYLQFSINIFIVLICYVLVFYDSFGWHGILSAIKEAVLFRDGLVPTFWCVMAMFQGSVICFVLGNYCGMESKWYSWAFMMITCFFLKFINVWLSICAMGAALRVFQEISISKYVRIAVCVVSVCTIPLLYRHPESTWTSFMQGCSCCLLIYVCSFINQLHWFKGRRGLIVLPFIGNISFYLFLWHTPVNLVLLTICHESLNIYLLFGISFTVSFLLSIIQYELNNKWISPLIKRIKIETI